MPEVETDADVVEVRAADHLHQAVWRGEFVRNVFQQNSYAEGLGKRTQVFDGGHRRFEFLLAETFVGRTQMLHQETKRDLLGNLEGALDLVHGVEDRKSTRLNSS